MKGQHADPNYYWNRSDNAPAGTLAESLTVLAETLTESLTALAGADPAPTSV